MYCVLPNSLTVYVPISDFKEYRNFLLKLENVVSYSTVQGIFLQY